MQDSLRLVFILIGIIAIGALLAHGYWSNRKKRFAENDDYSAESGLAHRQAEGEFAADPLFDADGVGKVRTISSTKNSAASGAVESKSSREPNSRSEHHTQTTQYSSVSDNERANDLHFSAHAESDEQNLRKFENNENAQNPGLSPSDGCSESQEAELRFAPPPKSLIKDPVAYQASAVNVQTQAKEKKLQAKAVKPSNSSFVAIGSAAENSKIEPTVTTKPATVESEFGKVQAVEERAENLDPLLAGSKVSNVKNFDAQGAHYKSANLKEVKSKNENVKQTSSSKVDNSSKGAAPAQVQDVYVLNVAAKEGGSIEGAKLLTLLLRLGFKFGDMDIFHRHQDAAGHGPILFSLANMVKPGVFDLDTIEQFRTQGLSLFFTAPCTGSAADNFKLMLQTAQKLASDLDAQLLDQHRNPLTEQAIRHTMNKALEFERQQLLGAKCS